MIRGCGGRGMVTSRNKLVYAISEDVEIKSSVFWLKCQTNA